MLMLYNYPYAPKITPLSLHYSLPIFFFLLSGFLITDLLIATYDRTGRPDLAGFWTRRARPLLPALAVMLVVVTAAAAVIEAGQEASLRLALLAAATYTSDWVQILHHVS